MNNIQIDEKGIGKLIFEGRLRVPVHQRNYYWKAETVVKLFEDFKTAVDPDKSYFLGTIVLKKTTNDTFLEVIDGQQRLATTMIILAKIRDIFNSRGDDFMVKHVENNFLFGSNSSTEEIESKLTLNLKDHNHFSISILLNPKDVHRKASKPSTAPSNAKLDTAAKLVSEKFHEALKSTPEAAQKDYLKRWIEFIEKRAKVVIVIAENDEDAYTMFETLNDRGMRMSQADMVKNYVLGKSGEDREMEIVAKWQSFTTMLESLGSEDEVVDYLRILSSVLYGLTREREVFGVIKSKVNSQGSAVRFVYQIEDFANDYLAMLSPDNQKWNDYPSSVRRSLRTLKIFDVQQIRYLMLAVAHHFSKHEAAKAFNLFVNWTVRFFIAASDKIGRVDARYATLAHTIHTTNEINTAGELAKRMSPYLASDEDFKSAFSIAHVSQAKLARYYLYAMERHKTGEQHAELVPDEDPGNVNLEHVIPLNAENNWPDLDKLEAANLYNRLGNMALIHAKKNSQIGNLGFAEKRKAFSNSTLTLTKRISKFQIWGPSEVKQRQSELAELAVKTWPLTAR